MSEGEIRFSREHEWLVMKEGIATMGISDFAQKQLGDIVSVELPRVGSAFKQMQPMAIVDSVKASSDIYSAITGEVIEVNEELLEHPELVNQSPQDLGWIVKIKPSDLQEFELLMSKDEYNSFVGEAEGSKKDYREKKIPQTGKEERKEQEEENREQ
jgi:glycine cleavage system H protein